MKVLIDADACPVTNIAIELCSSYGTACLLLCDTAHEFHRTGAKTLVFDKGADSVDYALVNRISPGDIVITQDYGLASMALARDALLFQRHESRKYRSAGGRTKGQKKRTSAQDQAFRQTLQTLLQG